MPPNAQAQMPPIARPRKKSPSDPPYDPAEIVGYVGSECIQANELLPAIDAKISGFLAKPPEGFLQMPPEERERQVNEGRKLMMKQALEETVKIKLLLSEVRRKVPAEGMKKTEEQIRKHFNANEIKPMMTMCNASSTVDLENKLRQMGSSIEVRRAEYIERQMALGWLSQQIKEEVHEVTHEQMLTYYNEHSADWDVPGRVRWEQISVKFTNFDSKGAAHDALARWGNEVFRGGSLATVAQAHSQEPAAGDGGVHDWVSRGSLRSTALDDALFALPPNMLSQIIEDDEGLHIVRVLEREDAKRKSFTEVQPEIKKILQAGDKDHARQEYVAKLREQIPVLTIFDDDFVARTSLPDATKLR
jgi:hypothetical protein